MTGPACGCGKVAYKSKAAADRAVIGAKIRRDLHGEKNRREERTYRCPGNRGLWHLTSQSGRFSPLPTYPETDDDAGRTFVARAVDHPRDEVWEALLADDRVRQTVRVLRVLQQDVIARRAGGFTDPVEQQKHLDWETAILVRLREARTAEKAFNVRETVRIKDNETRQNHYALRALTLAVAKHRQLAKTSTGADRELWDWLDTLTVPHSSKPVPLGDLVDQWREGTW